MCELILDDSCEARYMRYCISINAWFERKIGLYLGFDPGGYYQFLLDDDGA